MFEDIEDYINDTSYEQNTSNDYNTQLREREIQANYLLQAERINLLKNYRENDKSDRKDRKKYAKIFIAVVILQLIAINIMVICQGIGLFKLEATIFNVFLIGVFVELVAIVRIIFNNLFPSDYDKNKSDTQRSLLLNDKIYINIIYLSIRRVV